MLMNATAHVGCAYTIRESAQKVDSGRKITCCTWELNPHGLLKGPKWRLPTLMLIVKVAMLHGLHSAKYSHLSFEYEDASTKASLWI